MRSFLLVLTLVFAACSESTGQTEPGGPVAQGVANADFAPAFENQTRAPEMRSNVEVAIEVIAQGLEHPWTVAFLPDGRMLVTERPGRLRIVTRGGSVGAPITGLPEMEARNQGGLLDAVAGPNFENDRMIYWSYAAPRGGGANATHVARGRLSDDSTRVENVQVIFEQQPAWRSGGHFGSRLVFDREGHLYIALGDRQRNDARGLAQDLSTHIGKIVRINPDGSVPAGNPFSAGDGARPEIWSYGHRNIQGADLHPETGELWAVEHGPRGGDELNLIRRGVNFGWPVISYGIEYNGAPIGAGIAVRDGMEQPVYYWDPVIAPGDMDFYRGSLFPWNGDILIAGLESEALVRLELQDERVVGEERFNLGVGRIRDIAEADDGALWIVTDHDNGRLLRLTPRRESTGEE